MPIQKLSSEELLGLDKFNLDEAWPHIVVDRTKCVHCEAKPCLYICSARCYKPASDEAGIQFDYAGCLECGTCRVICRQIGQGGVVQWLYPHATFGVVFRFG